MEWHDDAVVLSARPQGESAALAVLLTRAHGRHAGLVRGGHGRHRRSVLESGTLVSARWTARLPEHLGALTLEPVRGYGVALLDQPERLAALVSACALVEVGLPEREPHPAIYRSLIALFDVLDQSAWAEATVRWEVGLLAELGFGLDLERCAVTGTISPLVGVSPRSGRAVSQAAAGPWTDRLLILPRFLGGQGTSGSWGSRDQAEVAAGLALTGHFLDRHLPGGLPPARRRFAERYGRGGPKSGREGATRS